MAELVVGQRRRSSVGLNDLQRIPESLAHCLLHLDPVGATEVLYRVVPVQPDSLTVLVEAETLNFEVFAEDHDDLLRVALHQVQLSTKVPELSVQILQTFQEEGDLVVLAVFGGRSLSIKYKTKM